MKKRSVSILVLVLALCLLFSGFTRVEGDTPSLFFGSADTEFGSFTVPVPDYYKKTKEGVYSYNEKGAETAAGLLITASGSGSVTAKDFSARKGDMLDNLMNKIGKCKRTAVEDLTVAGCPAVKGTYTDNDKETIYAVLVFCESRKEVLFLVCVQAKDTEYGEYLDDFMFMVNGIAFSDGGSGASTGASAGDSGVTMENFNKINTGMTYEQVCAIFGKEGVLMSEVDIGIAAYKTAIYTWTDSTGIANASITFQGGKVYMKSQFGLR